jgi:UDP-N-acetylmuramate dehydrogenase
MPAMRFRLGESLRAHNTLRLQARAPAFVTVYSDAELLSALAWARSREMAVIPLGEGSNVVFAGDVNALVVRQATRGIRVLERGSGKVKLQIAAGENWHELVRWTLQSGYFGLENLALIPGTVGAAPMQNIGAYGVELQSMLTQVHAWQIADDAPVSLDNESCQFAYRDSIFKHALKARLVISSIELELSLSPCVTTTYPALATFFAEHPLLESTPQTVFDTVVSIRRSKLPDPSREPNAGSFFKNPVIKAEVASQLLVQYPELPSYVQRDGCVKLSAAWLIDYCGWKGVRRENTGVHPQHALVLINYGGDNGRHLLALAADIAASVYQQFGVHLEIEPIVYGNSG